MTNEEVIEALAKIIARLQARLEELQAIQNVPGGPIEERTQRRAQILSEISALNVELTHLEGRKRDRELARSLDQAVPALSPERRQAMEDALNRVNEEIRADADFHAILSAAEQIVAAAGKANGASGMG